MFDLASPLTLTIVIATAAVTIVCFSNATLFRALLLSVRDVVVRGQGWRLFTSGLVHADWMHLAFNMFTLFVFGSWLEQMIDSWRFGMTYFLGIVVGSFASIIIHRNATDYHAVGASGGVCAVIGAATVIEPTMGMMIFPLQFPIPAWVVGMLFIAYTIVGSKKRMDNIGHEAHLGGTLAGMGMVAAFYPSIAVANILYILAILGAAGAAWLITRRMK
ncbi:MAG: rhomboid family intramembrane serine protease [bacterium]|nr:rhomboid family intramembrane serine protease [bacterium]